MAPARTKTRKVYTPKESFTVDVDGAPVYFIAGKTRVAEGHPVLKGREEMFKEEKVEYDWDGSTATSTRP